MSGPARIFDKPLLDRHRRRAFAAATAGADFLYRAAADDLIDRLASVKRDFAAAASLLRKVVAALPDDPVAPVYIERCAAYGRRPPPEGWDGVEVMEEK